MDYNETQKIAAFCATLVALKIIDLDDYVKILLELEEYENKYADFSMVYLYRDLYGFKFTT